MFAQFMKKTNPLIAAATNLLFPPRCTLCAGDVDVAHSVCIDCFTKLNLIAPPECARCGSPFAYDMGADAVCAECLQSPPPYNAARAAMQYDDASRKLITRLKYADKQDLVPTLAKQIWRSGAALCAQADYIIPVPLHPKRLRERKFNQSALLAYGLSDLCGVPVMADGLLRVENTPPQASLERAERLKNVKRAFRVNHKRAKLLRGASILLVDDVITTGATIHACSKALLGASAKAVYVLTIAKTVKD